VIKSGVSERTLARVSRVRRGRAGFRRPSAAMVCVAAGALLCAAGLAPAHARSAADDHAAAGGGLATPARPVQADGQKLWRPRRIAWGREIHGLQVGIDTLEVPRNLTLGQKLTLHVLVRSTGVGPIDLRLLSDLSGNEARNAFYWSAITTNGRSVSVSPSAPAGEAATTVLRLAAGEQLELPVRPVTLAFAATGDSVVTEPTAFVTPGRISIQVRPFRVFAPDEAWLSQAASPRITIDVGSMPARGASALPPNSGASAGSGARLPGDGPRAGTVSAPGGGGARAGQKAGPEARAKGAAQQLPARTAAKPAADAGIAWGDAADGLLAGARISGARRAFEAGDRVQLDCYIRNVTDKDISLAFGYRLYTEEQPEVRKASDPARVLPMHSVFLTGIDPAFVLTLKAGETIVVQHTGFVLGEKPKPLGPNSNVPKGLESYPSLDNPAPGSYTVKAPFIYRIETAQEVKRLYDRAHAKDRVIIEPFQLTIQRKDGSRYTTESTMIPVGPDMKRLTSGAAGFVLR